MKPASLWTNATYEWVNSIQDSVAKGGPMTHIQGMFLEHPVQMMMESGLLDLIEHALQEGTLPKLRDIADLPNTKK